MGPAKPSLAMTAAPGWSSTRGGPTVAGGAARQSEGPIAIQVEGDRSELTAAAATVPSGTGEAEASIAISAQEFATGGPRRLKVVARGGGLEVSSPVEVEVRELPAAIRLSAPPEIALPRGKGNALKVVVARDHYAGTVRVRCEGETEGLDFKDVVLEPDKAEAEFQFGAGEAAPGVRTLKLIATGGGAGPACRWP